MSNPSFRRGKDAAIPPVPRTQADNASSSNLMSLRDSVLNVLNESYICDRLTIAQSRGIESLFIETPAASGYK
jgi:hypothetical protein